MRLLKINFSGLVWGGRHQEQGLKSLPALKTIKMRSSKFVKFFQNGRSAAEGKQIKWSISDNYVTVFPKNSSDFGHLNFFSEKLKTFDFVKGIKVLLLYPYLRLIEVYS